MNNFNIIRTGASVLIICLSLFLPISTVLAQSPEPAELVEKGDQLLFQSDFVGAEEAYNAAITANPNNAAAYAHRCYLYTFQLRTEEAIRDCQQAITLAPQDAEGYIYLIRAYNWSTLLENAVEAGEQAIELAPDSGLAHSFLGEAYLNLGQLSEGEREIQLGVELAPDTAEVYHNLAYMYLVLGLNQDALDAIETAFGLAPNFATYHETTAGIYYTQGELDQALDHLQQGLTIVREVGNRVSEGKILNYIGILYNATGRYVEALESFQQALPIYIEVGDRVFESRILNNIGLIYDNQGRYDKALESYQQALPIVREVGDRALEGTILNNIGGAYDEQGRLDAALESYRQALAISREVGDQAEEGLVIGNIGLIYEKQGRYSEALENLKQALAIHIEVGNRAEEGVTLDNIGLVYHNQGRYDKAKENYEDALAIRREVGDRTGESVTLNNIAGLYHSQGRYSKALESFQDVLAIKREVGDRTGEGITLNNIGGAYYNQGHYDKALQNYQHALAISREVGDRQGEGLSLVGIGAVYDEQGNYDEAFFSFMEALTIQREVGDRAGEGTILNNIAGIYNDQQDYDKALDSYLKALAIYDEVGHQTGQGTALIGIGLVYDNQGRDELALKSYEQALLILRQVGTRSEEGSTLNNIGAVYSRQRRYEDALESYQKALAIQREVGDRQGEGLTLSNIGFAYEQQEQLDQALVYYEEAMNVFDSVRAVAGSELGRAGFIAQHADLYDNAVKLYHQQGQDEAAFLTSERGRARSFLDSLSTDYVQLSDNDAQELLDQEQKAYATLQATQDTLARAKALNPPDAEFVADLEQQLAEVEEAHKTALSAIEARGGQLADLVPGRTKKVSLSEIQANLPKTTTLVSYHILEDEDTLAFILTPNELKVVSLDVGSQDLGEQITTFSLSFTDPFFDQVDPHSSSELQQLYQWLITPLKPHLNTPGVTIIPHGILHYLPFAALTDGETYFSDDYVLSTLPSASVLPSIQENRKPDAIIESVLALGNPTYDVDLAAQEGLTLSNLPFAKREVETLTDLFGDQVEAHFGTEATESALGQAGQANILHIAAHGVYNPQQPLNSKLFLAPDTDADTDTTSDGVLEVGEVYGLELTDATLVVLSACETGLRSLNKGDDESIITDGDEIVALNRAFLFAGTPSVLSSLWSVDDASTGLLMERFYTHLQAGMGKAQALRQAQIEVREKNPQYAHPYYWAGFTLVGDMGEVEPIPDVIDEELDDEAGSEDVTDEELDVSANDESEEMENEVQEVSPDDSTSEVDEVSEPNRRWLWMVGIVLVLILLVVGGRWWMRRVSH